MSQLEIDKKFMQLAISEAKKANRTLPNPKVGCIITKNNQIIATGYHKKHGEAHAEVNAINNCPNKEDLKDSTFYVTLEPCSHHGKTPPCTNSIIKAKPKRVVIAQTDPNPRVNGQGIKILKAAGIEVTTNILEQEAKELNKVFLANIKKQRPYIYLKAAITIDGKIATKTFDSKWISSKESRTKVHQLRNKVDAILVGKNTVIKDNPKLTARENDKVIKYPTRIILASKQDIPKNYHILNQEGKNIFIKDQFPNKTLTKTLNQLLNQGIHSILVEGGSKVFSHFLEQNLVDEYRFYICPKAVADNNAISIFNGQNTTKMQDAINFTFTKVEKSGPDILIHAKRE
tara:strand:- start:89 stop:1123 length:1035 start_codon:yes stop_codon:yes gene_type:complete